VDKEQVYLTRNTYLRGDLIELLLQMYYLEKNVVFYLSRRSQGQKETGPQLASSYLSQFIIHIYCSFINCLEYNRSPDTGNHLAGNEFRRLVYNSKFRYSVHVLTTG
jgi:hypothetical protein